MTNTSNSQARVWCEALTYINFPTYSMDTSLSSNELHLVHLDDLESAGTVTIKQPLVVSPDWFLAAWSVDRNGTVDGARPVARDLPRVLSAFSTEQSAPNTLHFLFYHIYALGQAMSMVIYSTTPPSTSQERKPHLSHFRNLGKNPRLGMGPARADIETRRLDHHRRLRCCDCEDCTRIVCEEEELFACGVGCGGFGTLSCW